ncbi:MAG: Hsp70 family protein, partial [Miltoncostaeaceae bacterium]
LLDVTPLSLGIETRGGVFTKLIERNTTIPTKKSEVFSTADDNQSQVEIHVLQGEREMAAYNRTLGKFSLTGIPPAPSGVPQIEVTFDIDANGIVNVTAKDLGTGTEQKIEIKSSSGLSDDEISKMVDDAESHAEEDKRLRRVADARNGAEARVREAERQLADNGDKVDEAVRRDLEGAIAAAKASADGDDPDDIEAKTGSLLEALHKLSEQVYQRAAGEQQAGEAGGGDDNVEDAEYEVIDSDDEASDQAGDQASDKA